jgi:Heavy metal binding domain
VVTAHAPRGTTHEKVFTEGERNYRLRARIPTSGSTLILAARALLLMLAAAAVVTAFLMARRHAPPGGEAQLYTCAMHPEITARAPGQCPICRMALEPVRARSATSQPSGQATAERDPAAAPFTVVVLAQDRLFADIMGVRSRPVTRQIVAAAWVDSPGTVMANLYRDEIAVLGPRDDAVFVAGSGATAETHARLTASAPTAWDGTTVVVRLQTVTRTAPVGTIGWVRFAPRARRLLAVPYSAVLQAATGPYVLVASVDRHTFTRRPVQLGRVVYGYAPVLSGLTSDERVAVMETFFIDAEGRLGSQNRRAGVEAPP